MPAPPISDSILWFFRRIVRRYFARQFHAVYISNRVFFASLTDGPLLIYANHSSWWDPMLAFLLASEYLPTRRHYAPMDAVALRRYGILRRLGIFGVELSSVRGAIQFLKTGLEILNQNGVLWVTPQGKFVDPRRRPLVFKTGLASLACKVKGGCIAVPLAIEYAFWDERLPEALLHFGKPIHIQSQSVGEVDRVMNDALTKAMDELAAKTIARDASNFELLQSGRSGTGGFYEFGQRIRAYVSGGSYRAVHTAPEPPKERE